MFVLLFFVSLIQFFMYWIFGPLTSLLTNLLEIRFFTEISLLVLFFLFYKKDNN